MLRQLKALFKLPAAQRSSQLKLHLAKYSTKVIYSSFGYWLNRSRSPFILEIRPDLHSHFDRVNDYDALFRLWVAGNHDSGCGDLSRFYSLYLNVSQVLGEGVPGDFVELGVYKGNSAGVLAHMARRHERRVFLFDTFGGFDERDLHGLDSGRSVRQFTDTSLMQVQKLVGTESVTYVPGFFPESAATIQMPERIAVVHIDCDLYEPMKAGLEWFYPRLSPGGVMLLHDYSSGHWPGATRAINEFFKDRSEKPILMPDKSGTAVLRKPAMVAVATA